MIRRTSVRLNTHRSATASGRSLTGLHPMRSPCSSSVTTGILLHCQRLSVGQYFCAPCRFPCFPVAAQWAQRKPPFDSVSMERSWGKSSQKLLLCVTVEACQVGDYRSYFLLTHTAPAPAHTPAQPDHRRQPMRWTPLRTIAEVTPVLYPAPVAAPSLAEYSKGSSTLCDGDPFG